MTRVASCRPSQEKQTLDCSLGDETFALDRLVQKSLQRERCQHAPFGNWRGAHFPPFTPSELWTSRWTCGPRSGPISRLITRNHDTSRKSSSAFDFGMLREDWGSQRKSRDEVSSPSQG